jgi:hypothetical protein
MSAPDNTWLYAVVAADREPPAGVSGVVGESPRIVSGPGLAAVVGSVPRAHFDDETLQAHLEDPGWLEPTVRAHHDVIDALAQDGPVLPVRFATVYRDDQRVVAMLQNQRRDLLRALERMAGRTEWGVKVYVGPRRAKTTGETRTAGESRPGTAYLLQRKAQQEDRSQMLRRAADEAQKIHATLASTAAASTCHPLQTSEASGRREPMVLNAAYLIADDRFSVLEDVVSSVAADHPELRVEVTGPWPPYSFSNVGPEPDPSEP